MLTYRNTAILFIILLAGMMVADIYLPFSKGWYVLLFAAWMALLVLGSIKMKMHFYIRSVMGGNPCKKEVAFSFDDGPDSEITPKVLEILREHGIKAVFFTVGSKIEGNTRLVKQMDEEGHLVGGHSFSHHFFFDLMPYSRLKNELESTEDLIFKITGKKIKWFRPPYGVTNPSLARAIRHMGYLPVGWTLKSLDTVIDNERELVERIRSKIRPGDLLLFHDTKPVLTRALPLLIRYLNEQQYRIVSPDELLKTGAYEQV